MKQTTKYFVKLFATYAVTLFSAISFCFFLFRMIPGDPVKAIVNDMYSSIDIGFQSEIRLQMLDMYVEAFGLDQDVWTQFVSFWRELLFHGNLGPSFWDFPQPAWKAIVWRLPWTIGLLGVSTIISWVLGTLIGALAGWKQGSKLDKVLNVSALTISPFPQYLTAIIIILVTFYLGGTIAYGAFNPRLDPGLYLEFIVSVIEHAIPPALAIVASTFSYSLIAMRQLIVPTLGEDFLLFAEAKGLRSRRIFFTYAFRNSLLPQATVLAIQLGAIMSGSILVENIFNYPGIGYLFNTALYRLDYNVIMGCLLIIMFTSLTATLLIDILLPFIDPRISYEE